MERSKDWLDEAIGDIEHAKVDLSNRFYNWACFSAQQSAEKAIKAVFGLPSDSPRRKYTEQEAKRLIGYAEEIFKFCQDILSKI